MPIFGRGYYDDFQREEQRRNQFSATNLVQRQGENMDSYVRRLQEARDNPGGNFNPIMAHNQLVGAQRQLAERQAQQRADAGRERVGRARDELFSLGRGRVSELQADPTDRMILGELQKRISGENVPFDDATVNSLMSGASDQAAAAERQQLRSLGRPGNPATQSARREIQANRQLGMQRARQGINTQKRLTNFDAVTQALGQGGAFNAQRNDRITDAERFLADLLRRETFTDNRNTATGGY